MDELIAYVALACIFAIGIATGWLGASYAGKRVRRIRRDRLLVKAETTGFATQPDGTLRPLTKTERSAARDGDWPAGDAYGFDYCDPVADQRPRVPTWTRPGDSI